MPFPHEVEAVFVLTIMAPAVSFIVFFAAEKLKLIRRIRAYWWRRKAAGKLPPSILSDGSNGAAAALLPHAWSANAVAHAAYDGVRSDDVEPAPVVSSRSVGRLPSATALVPKPSH